MPSKKYPYRIGSWYNIDGRILKLKGFEGCSHQGDTDDRICGRCKGRLIFSHSCSCGYSCDDKVGGRRIKMTPKLKRECILEAL